MDMSPILISMKTAAYSIFFTFFLGIFAAWLVIKTKRRIVKIILDGLFTMPLVLPPTVAGFFLLCIFGAKRPIGMFFIQYFNTKIAFTWTATVIAAVVMSFPLMYRSARGAFEQVDPNLMAAARTLGMGESKIFFKVLLANSMPGIISGGILAYARGLGEFGATAMLAGNMPGKTQTLPMAVYSKVSAGNYNEAYQYVMIIMVIAFIAIVILNLVEFRTARKKSI